MKIDKFEGTFDLESREEMVALYEYMALLGFKTKSLWDLDQIINYKCYPVVWYYKNRPTHYEIDDVEQFYYIYTGENP